MKKILTSSLLLLSVVTLAACSGNNSSNSATKESTAKETSSSKNETSKSETSKSETSNNEASKKDSSKTSDFTLLTDEEIDKAKTIGDMKTLYGKLIDSYKKYVKGVEDKIPADQKESYKDQVEPALEAMESSRTAFNEGLSSAGSDDTAMPEEARTPFLQQLKTARDSLKQALKGASSFVTE